jgi:hypothetical protein
MHKKLYSNRVLKNERRKEWKKGGTHLGGRRVKAGTKPQSVVEKIQNGVNVGNRRLDLLWSAN